MTSSQTSSPPVVDLVPATMGAQGDAVADFAGRRVFVPFALPGERVRATLRAKSADELIAADLEVLAPAPDRVAPPCRHFGVCGGCKLQHWADASYRTWKVELVRQALRHHSLDLPTKLEAVFVPAGNRRRAEFAAMKRDGVVTLGFQEARGHRIVDQQECPILAPGLAHIVAPLRAALGELLSEGQAIDVLATATDSGLDLAIAADRAPTERQRLALARFAEAAGIARITWRGKRGEAEPIVQLRTPQLAMGGVVVDLPSPAFLQPSAAGEAALRQALLALLVKPKRIAELYAGNGTFTFDLAKLGQVHAVEGSKSSLQALELAARRAQLSHRITAETRDLERAPLTLAELKPFDTVVFDPPRAGAKAQSEILARSAVRQVVGISCNPATFARDARTLADGGYVLSALTVVDQFIWSPHVEIVAAFRRSR